MLTYHRRVANNMPPSSLTQLRQQLCAIKIIRYVGSKDRLNSLQPLPIVVRAISLAVSAFLRQLQSSRLISEKTDAQREYLIGCDALRTLHAKWATAQALGGLAHDETCTFDKLPSRDKFQSSQPIRKGILCQVEASALVGGTTAGLNEPQSLDWISEGFISEPMPMVPASGTNDLFPELDDTLWMHLDVTNIANANNLTLANFDDTFHA